MSEPATGDAEMLKLRLELVRTKIDGVRTDRAENLRSLVFFGAIVLAFLGVVRLGGLQELFTQPAAAGFPFRAALLWVFVLGAVGALAIWLHTRQLHLAELRMMRRLPELLETSELDPGQAFEEIMKEDEKDWSIRRLYFWPGYWALSASLLGFVLTIAVAIARATLSSAAS